MIDAGLRQVPGPVRDGRRDHPPRARGASGHRAADRVLADEPGDRGGDPADGPGARHRRDRLRGPVPRPAHHRERPRDRARRPEGQVPRFQGENLQRNLDLLAALEKIARDHGVTTAQLAIAWVPSRGTDIVPLIGTKRRDRLAEALGALDLELTPGELAALEAAVPADQVAGDRYEAAQMAGAGQREDHGVTNNAGRPGGPRGQRGRDPVTNTRSLVPAQRPGQRAGILVGSRAVGRVDACRG